jgi:bifunctional DNA-binding transcriptional regulator/antitoxin component of YhaV-PrlF toxin-antitoxin module
MHRSQLSAEGHILVPQEIREVLALKPGDSIQYEVHEGMVILKRAAPFDVEFHHALAATLNEWDSPEDDEAFRGL